MVSGRRQRTLFETVWQRICSQQGRVFRQIRGREFTYRVMAQTVRPSTTNWNIPKAHFEEAYGLMPLDNTVPVQHLYGPSYIYAILTDPRIGEGMAIAP